MSITQVKVEDNIDHDEATLTTKNKYALPLMKPEVGGTILFASIVCSLHVLDQKPWPTIGALCVTYGFFLLNHYPKRATAEDDCSSKKKDTHISFFLCTQLILNYFSKFDPYKGPHGDSPLSASQVFQTTNKHLRMGFADLVFQDSVEQQDTIWLEVIEKTCLISWILAIVLSFAYAKDRLFSGWIRKTIFIVLAVSYVFLHGIMASFNGVSHRFYMTMYSFIAILLEVLFDVDSDPYICLFAGFTFFSAGISKLRNSNFTWHDGKALCRFIGKDYTGFFRYFCSIMAPASIAFEIVAPFLMFLGWKGRFSFVLLALSFHLGIATLMLPRYTPQSCSYALIFRANDIHENNKTKTTKQPLLFLAISTILLVTSVFRIEVWPLTAVPMYSVDMPNPFGGTLSEAHDVAEIVHKSSCLAELSFPNKYMNVWVDGGDTLPEDCRGWRVWFLSDQIGKKKLIKYVLLRGLSSALVCMEDDTCANNSNYWLDKYAQAIQDECSGEADAVRFELKVWKPEPYIVPLYSWTASNSTRPGVEQQIADEL